MTFRTLTLCMDDYLTSLLEVGDTVTTVLTSYPGTYVVGEVVDNYGQKYYRLSGFCDLWHRYNLRPR